MELNFVIYPAPEPSVDLAHFLNSQTEYLRKKVILVDALKAQVKNGGFVDDRKKKQNLEVDYQIPCMYFSNANEDIFDDVFGDEEEKKYHEK